MTARLRRHGHRNKGGSAHYGQRAASLASPLVHDIGVDAVGQRNASQRGARLGALGKDLLFELGAVPPAHLLLGFIHGVHLNPWWTPSLPFRPIPSRVGCPRAYGGRGTETNEGAPITGNAPPAWRRHLCTTLALMPWDSAMRANEAPGSAHSERICCLNSARCGGRIFFLASFMVST